MGVGASVLNSEIKRIALTCAFKRGTIDDKLDMIKDANDVMQSYAQVLLMERMPNNLPDYKNYKSSTRAYFDSMAKVQVPQLKSANYKITNYKDFYMGLEALKAEYEQPMMTEEMKRSKITDIFNLSYIVMMTLIDDVKNSCKII